MRRAASTVLDSLKAKDRSAYILSQYIPTRARNGFLGLRGFYLNTAKVVDSATEPAVSGMRLEFWKTMIQKIFNVNTSPSDLEEPVSDLLHSAIHADNLTIHKKYLLTIVQTQQSRLSRPAYRTIENMEQYGEGVFSQLNYATLDMLQSAATRDYLVANPDLDEMVTNACAHIGQSLGIASLLRGFNFYAAKHNFVNLPVSLLTDAGISQQQVLDAADNKALGQVEGLKDVVFKVATRANDHILTAQSLLQQFEAETKKKIPLSVLLPAMNAVPLQLYLEQLQKADFDLGAPVTGDWKLPWRTWRVYNKRMI